MKTKIRHGFGPKLEAVLARLCERLGSLYKTQAVKLPYLVDVVAAKGLGRRITDATFEAWKQGVVAREAWVGVTYPREGCFKIEHPEYDEGWTVKLAGRPSVRLSPEELAIVDFVADQYGSLTAQDLDSLTKSLNPEIPREKWGSNAQPAINEDVYVRLSKGWQNLWRQLPLLDLTDPRNGAIPSRTPTSTSEPPSVHRLVRVFEPSWAGPRIFTREATWLALSSRSRGFNFSTALRKDRGACTRSSPVFH